MGAVKSRPPKLITSNRYFRNAEHRAYRAVNATSWGLSKDIRMRRDIFWGLFEGSPRMLWETLHSYRRWSVTVAAVAVEATLEALQRITVATCKSSTSFCTVESKSAVVQWLLSLAQHIIKGRTGIKQLLCSELDDNIDASDDPEPIMLGDEDISTNPACQAILANEVGLASADFQDDRLRKGQANPPSPPPPDHSWPSSHPLPDSLQNTSFLLDTLQLSI